mmetsp:Transcript_22059/g.77319  ORF Transcript_22059/g.77319 Transcript_22059/m.77319 type:complete len:306 (+) Transcript_22059:10001-10918(+)
MSSARELSPTTVQMPASCSPARHGPLNSPEIDGGTRSEELQVDGSVGPHRSSTKSLFCVISAVHWARLSGSRLGCVNVCDTHQKSSRCACAAAARPSVPRPPFSSTPWPLSAHSYLMFEPAGSCADASAWYAARRCMSTAVMRVRPPSGSSSSMGFASDHSGVSRNKSSICIARLRRRSPRNRPRTDHWTARLSTAIWLAWYVVGMKKKCRRSPPVASVCTAIAEPPWPAGSLGLPAWKRATDLTVTEPLQSAGVTHEWIVFRSPPPLAWDRYAPSLVAKTSSTVASVEGRPPSAVTQPSNHGHE